MPHSELNILAFVNSPAQLMVVLVLLLLIFPASIRTTQFVRSCTKSNPQLVKPVGGIMTFVGAILVVFSLLQLSSPLVQLNPSGGGGLIIALLAGIVAAIAGLWLLLAPAPPDKRN